jgi:NodT family efflux transporter outer membrane factor (OMF) lipoprotein
MVGPDYQTPSLPVPPAWSDNGPPRVATTNDTGALERWWEAFSDTNLSALVECARLNNLDVAQAEARLRKARAQRNLTRAERLPTVEASGSASRSRGSEKTGSGQTSTLYANAFDATWEADLFGAKRRAAESSEASLQATREDLRDVSVSLFAEVALNYVGYRSYQVRLAITEANLASQTETYEIACWRQQANLVTQLDVDQARLSLEQTRAEIPSLRTGRDQAEHQLATLLGQAPGSLVGRLGDGQAVPVAADTIAMGVPADVVRRRPDVRKAERALAAQTAQIGVAQAARYPDLTLSGSIGLEALKAGDLYTVAARSASGAVKAGWTLFDGGQLRQKVAIETAYQEELFGAYEQAVLTALQDVENALTAYANEQARRRALADAVVAGQSAFRLARDKYASGLIDFETVLSTQQSLLSVQNSLASSEADLTSDLIRLYKALGGGWDPLAPDGDEAKDKRSGGPAAR